MAKFNELKAGDILGESQYYTVEKIAGERVQLKTPTGSVVVDKGYVETYLDSANQFTSESDATKTQLADIFINNPRIVMTVAFFKQDKDADLGECHRLPPTLLPETDGGVSFSFALTASDEWCGEFVRYVS